MEVSFKISKHQINIEIKYLKDEWMAMVICAH
jgi:hypothetical protein